MEPTISRSAGTMRALVQQTLNGPQDLVLQSASRPAAGNGEYLIRVGAAGVNFADVMQTRGTYGGGPAAPYIAGFEAAGEIVAVGPGVENPYPLGTHVIGAGPGAFAEYLTLPAAGALPIPAGWTDAEALGMVLNWATALAALKPLGEVRAGETVLIYAAAGGVGQAAVRLAHHYGARVIATSSPAKHHGLKELGAEIVLDSRHPRLAEEIAQVADGIDIVLESVGKATFSTTLAVTKPVTGRIIVFGAASGNASISTHELIFEHRVQIKGLHIGELAIAAPSIYSDLVEELRTLIAQGVYRPGIPEIHPLRQGPAVLQQLGSGDTSGKHALDPWA